MVSAQTLPGFLSQMVRGASLPVPTCPPGAPDKAETWVAERQPTYCAFFLPNIRLQVEIPFQPWCYCLCGWHL